MEWNGKRNKVDQNEKKRTENEKNELKLGVRQIQIPLYTFLGEIFSCNVI